MRWYSYLPLATLAGCAAIAAGGCARESSSAATRDVGSVDQRVVELFGGAESTGNILAPTKVEAFRVDGRPGERSQTSKPFYGYPIVGAPVQVDADTSEELAEILMDANIYDWDLRKKCEFMPGVALRFTSAGSPTEVLFCFSCDELMVVRDGKKVGYEDFDPARGRLLTIVKRLFPEDEKIQQLKDEREG